MFSCVGLAGSGSTRFDPGAKGGRLAQSVEVDPAAVAGSEAAQDRRVEAVFEGQDPGRVGFFIAKAHFYGRHRDQLNERQAKVIERMFREGPDGFKGGLSAENYISITGISRATATRDLQELVEIGALTRTGERRYTRYWLKSLAGIIA